jgi:hypothetical protein
LKQQKTFPMVIWFLLGILGLAAFTLSLGSNDTTTDPSPTSYKPSGTKAMADLLRSQGHTLNYAESPNASTKDKPILVVFSVVHEDGGIAGPVAETDAESKTDDQVRDYLADGGTAIWLGIGEEFASESKTAATTTSIDGPAGPLTVNTALVQNDHTALTSEQGFQLASTPSGPLATLISAGKGKLLAINDGIIATNRFIDKNENAAALLSFINTVAPPHSSFLVLGASFNGAQAGILDTLGSWAVAAWWQIILLFVVIVFTLGKPFGYPEESRRKLLGTRDMVDAVAQTYKRARATHVALSWLAEDADHEIRNRLKLSKDTPDYERNRLIPPELAQSLANAQAASELRPQASNALQIAKRLDVQMKSFFGDRRPRARRKFTK